MRLLKFGAAAVTVLGGVTALAGPASAHHSFAMFDLQRQSVLAGTVRQFQWTNPHSWIELTVQNDKGGLDAYSIEMNSPNNLVRQGWKSTSLKPGDKVVLTMSPTRDGSKGGLFVAVVLPDGRTLGNPTQRAPVKPTP